MKKLSIIFTLLFIFFMKNSFAMWIPEIPNYYFYKNLENNQIYYISYEKPNLNQKIFMELNGLDDDLYWETWNYLLQTKKIINIKWINWVNFEKINNVSNYKELTYKSINFTDYLILGFNFIYKFLFLFLWVFLVNLYILIKAKKKAIFAPFMIYQYFLILNSAIIYSLQEKWKYFFVWAIVFFVIDLSIYIFTKKIIFSKIINIILFILIYSYLIFISLDFWDSILIYFYFYTAIIFIIIKIFQKQKPQKS